MTGRKRQGSSGSRTQRPTSASGEKSVDPPTSAGRSSVQKSKKGGVSRFLAILNCCRAPDDAHAVDTNSPEASRKVARPSQSTQNTPSTKQDASAGEVNNLETKEKRQEQATATPQFPTSAVTTGDKMPAAPRIEDPVPGKGVPDIPAEVMAPTSGEKTMVDKPLPASPKSPMSPSMIGAGVGVAGTAAVGAGALAAIEGESHNSGTAASANPQVTVSSPTPITTEEQAINDRTAQQVKTDEDIEMTDAAPSIPLASSDVAAVTGELNTQADPQVTTTAAPIVVPPPPASGDRQNQAAQSKSAEPKVPDAPIEGKKWLLPAIRPEFKGRKCLVLDLDETLVHSSFKVSVAPTQA